MDFETIDGWMDGNGWKWLEMDAWLNE